MQPSALPDLDFNLRPTGTGPFQLVQLTGSTVGAGVTGAELRPFPNYYGQKPLLSELRFRFYPDQATALRAYQAGEVDGLARVAGRGLELAQALADPSLSVYTSREPRLTLVLLNLGDDNLPFFRDKQVRHALLYGLNRQWMVDNLLNGQAIVAESPILPGNWAYDDSYPATPYDPPRAAELLDAAGWLTPPGTAPGDLAYVRAKDGREFSFTILTTDDPRHAALAETAQQNLALLGVRTGVKPVPAAELFSQHVEPRAYEAALVDINLSRYPDPDPYPFWHQTQAQSGQNYGQVNERTLSEALELARITPKLEDRAKLYRTFQSRFAGLTPALLLYYPVYNYAVSANVAGITLGPLVDPSDRFNTIANWHLRNP
ncbi:MAG: hypothetical protein HY784_08155 [Chloroflexi bacterium]|nr:hypothetical protein [Chloroflexota bacterium]